MTLYIPDKWIWDFWLAQNGPDYHLFYLQAPRSLLREELRHQNATIGHAVSQDLRYWEILPDALHPGPAPAWDDAATWTGSIIQHNGLWYMFYTGVNHAEKGLVQRIGLATSSDLVRWQKHPANPLIEADPQYYELLDLTSWHDQAWRDPWVFRHPDTGDFHAFITARVNTGPADARGVIGHARSTNLINWEVLPPVTAPGEFGHLEVPQVVNIHPHYYLLFSTNTTTHAAQRLQRTGLPPQTGTHYLVSRNPLGPYAYLTDEFLVGDRHGSLYAGKLVQAPDGQWTFLAWRGFTATGDFIGALADPIPVEVNGNGLLKIQWPEPPPQD